MNEYFKLDPWIDFVSFRHCVFEFGQCIVVVVLGVNNEDQRSTATENHIRIESWVYKINLPGKVPDLKLHEATVVDVVLDNFAR